MPVEKNDKKEITKIRINGDAIVQHIDDETNHNSKYEIPGKRVFDTIESNGSKDIDISLMTGKPNNKGSESK